MLPNQGDSVDGRLDELSWAIKMVYASTFTKEARQYAESTLNRTEEEKMAVILQVRVVKSSEHYGSVYILPTFPTKLCGRNWLVRHMEIIFTQVLLVSRTPWISTLCPTPSRSMVVLSLVLDLVIRY